MQDRLGLLSAALADDLTGRASVINGDTVETHGSRIRLRRVGAPESTRLCRGEDSERYRCGARAATAPIRTHLIHRPARDIFPLLGGSLVFSYRVLNIDLKKMGWLQLKSHYAEVSKGVAGAAFARRQAWNAPVANEFVVRHPLEAAATLSRVFWPTLGPAIPRRCDAGETKPVIMMLEDLGFNHCPPRQGRAFSFLNLSENAFCNSKRFFLQVLQYEHQCQFDHLFLRTVAGTNSKFCFSIAMSRATNLPDGYGDNEHFGLSTPVPRYGRKLNPMRSAISDCLIPNALRILIKGNSRVGLL